MTQPLSPLQVIAGYVRILAAKQREVVDAVWDARFIPVDISARVEKTHGTVCDDTYKAFKRAESERERASRMVQSQSEDLAVKLDHAAEAYEAIDAQEKANLDQQMQPGG